MCCKTYKNLDLLCSLPLIPQKIQVNFDIMKR